MLKKNYFILIFVFWIFFIISCNENKINKDLVLNEIGPSIVKIGKGFNIQPNGESAMWFRVLNAESDTIIFLGEERIKPDFHNPELLTCEVPKHLYTKLGKYEVYLLNPKNNKKSNSLYFIVE